MNIKYSLIAGALLFSTTGVFAGAGTNGTAEQNASAYEEARTRISPIIVSLQPSDNVKSCGFSAGEDYTIQYITMGYEESMDTYITMYDCDGIGQFNCGMRYNSGEKVVESDWIEPEVMAHEDWSYTDSAGTKVYAYLHGYEAPFTMSANGTDDSAWTSNDEGGDEIVVRWWQKASETADNIPSISLLIGTEAARHYGYNMRRVKSKTSDGLNPASDTCANK